MPWAKRPTAAASAAAMLQVHAAAAACSRPIHPLGTSSSRMCRVSPVFFGRRPLPAEANFRAKNILIQDAFKDAIVIISSVILNN
jgi:hypothetical protein